MKISGKTTMTELGAIVCEALKAEGIDAFLSGGAVVSIYTENKYQSWDLDLITAGSRKTIKKIMLTLGFNQDTGRHFIHPDSRIFVEFPGSAVLIGDQPITEFKSLKTKAGTLKLLMPTDCVKDRLAAYIHWNDKQSLEQAVWVALKHPVKLEQIKKFCQKENAPEKYNDFLAALKGR